MKVPRSLTLENVSPSTTPANTSIDTSDIEDFGARISAVTENALAERRANALSADADEDQEDNEVGPPDVDEDGEDIEAAPPPPVAKKAPPAPAAPSAEEKARKASLVNAARLERESVRKSTELAAKAAELKAQESKFADREAKLTAFEKAYNDPDALLGLLAEKVSPDKMAQFFIEAGQPDKVAERRAKAAQEPVNSEISKLREEMAALKAEAETHKAHIARAASEKEFAARVTDIKDEAPRAARLLSKRPKEFFSMADAAATTLLAADPAATWDDVIHDVNKQLEDFARDLQDEQAADTTNSTQKLTTKNTAAAKASTVSNRAASERSTVLNEDEKWDALPLEERVRRAEKRARQTG